MPVSELVVTGMLRTQTDDFPNPKTVDAEILSVDFALITHADDAQLVVEPPKGALSTYKGSFSLLPDGRLSSASSDTTGEVGSVIRSIASIAGGAAALLALGTGEDPEDDLHNTNLLNSFAVHHSDSKNRLVRLRNARARLAEILVDGLTDETGSNHEEVRGLRVRLSLIDEQMLPLVSQFRAWRQSKITTVDQQFEFRVPLASLPTQALTAVPSTDRKSMGTAGSPSSLADLWTRFGHGVRAEWIGHSDGVRHPSDDAATAVPDPPDKATVYTRRPELIELVVFRQAGQEVVRTGSMRAFVADSGSEVVAYKLEKSWFGRRSLALSFDSDGFVAAVSLEGSSSIAGALATGAALPESFAGGIESSTKSYSSLQAAGRASIEAETARLKAEVEGRQQRILAAGLDATAQDAVELQRLQQLQGILETQTKIRSSDPKLVTDLARRAGADLAWYSPPTMQSPEPQVVRVVLATDQQRGDVTQPTEQKPPPTL